MVGSPNRRAAVPPINATTSPMVMLINKGTSCIREKTFYRMDFIAFDYP